jgi:hypothetical protein
MEKPVASTSIGQKQPTYAIEENSFQLASLFQKQTKLWPNILTVFAKNQAHAFKGLKSRVEKSIIKNIKFRRKVEEI